jgi:hypothetical protein
MIHGMADDLITLADLARRVGLSSRRVRQIADADPAFPPRRRLGRYWVVSYSEARAYFAARGVPGKSGRPRRQR